MSLDNSLIGSVINALPMDRMIAGPLQAMVQAQVTAPPPTRGLIKRQDFVVFGHRVSFRQGDRCSGWQAIVAVDCLPPPGFCRNATTRRPRAALIRDNRGPSSSVPAS